MRFASALKAEPHARGAGTIADAKIRIDGPGSESPPRGQWLQPESPNDIIKKKSAAQDNSAVSRTELQKVMRATARVDRGSELSLLRVIHLLFNEGYWSSGAALPIRSDLCQLAIGLCRSLQEAMPNDAEVIGLLALMMLHDARRDARIDERGELVPFPEQDRSRWDAAAIGVATRAALVRAEAHARNAAERAQIRRQLELLEASG